MLMGKWQDAVIDIDVDDDCTAEVDLLSEADTLLVVCPTLTVSAYVTIKVAEVSGGTFQDLYITDPADGHNTQVASSSYASGVFTWVVPIGGFRYIKIALSASQTGSDKTFRVCGVRS